MRKTCLLATLGLTMAAPMSARAEFVMYDFEKPLQFEDWTVQDPDTQTTAPSGRFATTGETSVHLKAEPSAKFPPRFNLRVWDNNYEPYNRIAFDITNASDQPARLIVALIGDIDSGYRFHLEVPPLSHKRVVQKIELPRFIRHDNIHFITVTGETDLPVDVYIDSIVALEKDDQAPDEKATPLADEVAQLRQSKTLQMIDQTRAAIRGQALDLPEAKQMMLAQLEDLEKQARGELSQEATVELVDQIRKAGQTADRFAEIREYVDQYRKDTSAGFVVGFADPMTKIMPKHLRTNLDITDSVRLSLAGGEKEAFQVAIVPFKQDAKGVNVSMSDLKGPDGAVIPADQIDTDLMSYAKTERKTEPQVDYVGWWPEPIIPTDEAIDVALGDVHSWWVRVRAARDQQPGIYTGTLTVSAEGQEDLTFPVTTEVYGFNVPKHAPIPTSITYQNNGFLKHPMIGSKERWNELKFDHMDVLNDYYMNGDNIYRWADPDRLDSVDWDLIEYQKEKGTLVGFNITHFHGADDKFIDTIRPYYEEAKKRGLLEHAYIYGYDETPPYSWESINKAAGRLAEEFPEVLTMTTSQDHSYGFNSPIQNLTAWCPIISRYNPELADKAREEGRKVWWYTCIWPPRPYPNVFTDYPAVDNRVLTGLMHMKYQPDGFLYYHTSIWDENPGIKDFPYTNWNPFASHINANGDGSLYNIMADGTLLPTIRVENYRDGFEDLAYYMILEHQVKQYEKSDSNSDDAWLRAAKAALDDIDTYVRSRTDWTESAEDIYAYRDRIATLIEASPIEDTDPWKNGMGIRGLPRD